MKTQVAATVDTIMEVLAERGVEYQLDGPTPISEVLTKNDKTEVRERLFQQFRDGEVSVSQDFADSKLGIDSELNKYLSGLINNWVRKYKPFNSGQAYEAKNPGSRAGAGDMKLQELKKLSAQVADDPQALKLVADAILARKAEIEAERAKTITINVDAIPAELRHLIKN